MRHFARFTLSALLVCLFFLTLSLTPSVQAAGITVNSNADTTADDGTCTLREAIDNANSDSQPFSTSGECAAGSGTDTITFDAGLSGATISLGSALDISSDMTIDGSALASQVTISGGGSVRVFTVNSGTVTLNSLTITNGRDSIGGGILNASGATLAITNSTLSDNKAVNGAGIRNEGTLTVTNSTFSNNSATGGSGGGIRNTGALTVTNSTFSNNSTTGSGGGIYNRDAYTLTVTNSTFSGNSAGSQGGGIYYDGGILNFANTIIANSGSGRDCEGSGTIGTNINNLVEDVVYSCSASLSGDPLLDSLQDNGGPTQTFALKLSSPAIGAGDTTTCTNAPVNNFDQRGATRPIGALCDIGAHETENRVVTNTDDNGDGFCDANCSLREAIDAAIDGDVITFDASLSGGTITLASQLEILKNVTIDGSDLASKITISGNSSTRVFYVGSAATATLDSLIVTQGRVEGCCGAGLLNNGTLTITNSLFSANNNNNGTGGAIMNSASGTLTVTGSTISGNSASNGGGIGNWNQMTITNSTLAANSSGDAGGGIFNEGAAATLTVTNSTFSGNTASTNGFGSGGGIFSSGPMTVKNSTFSGNSAAYDAGGIAQDSGTLNFSNTIIANSAGGDCYRASATGVNLNNLVEDGSCANIPHDPNLGPLANNGGPTQTFALLANSPAIDAGDDATCATPEVNNLDQRGIARPNGGHCDIGAYEYVDTTAPTVTAFSVPASPTTLNIPITDFTVSEDAILTGYLITESATPPTLVNPGWTASAPTTYPVASMGSYTLYPWAKDAAGHVSAVYGSGVTVNITCLTPITVTSSADSGPGTLRQAISDACTGDINNISMIDFDSALSGSTIHLSSELTIAKNVTIDGSDLASRITISGDSDNNGTGDVRVFSITGGSPGLTVSLDSLIVTKGVTSGHGAGLFMEQGMHVTIQNSTFSDNHAGGRGGGIGNQGGLTLINSTISGNSAASADGGGGISNESGLTMTNSTISNNSATGATASGGGLFNTGGAAITNSTIFGNSSSVYGGGISTTANLILTNSTIAGNSAAVTGGLQVDGNVTHLRNTIIANNSSTTINSLIHNDCSDTTDYPNQPTPDGDGIMTNANNLIEDGSCSPSLSGDALLGPLADNGGPTQTMALQAGSDAIDAADDTICAGTYHPATNPNPVNSLDQRGVARPNSAHCDIGAYEYADASDPSVTAFTPASPTNNLNIPITAFTASDDATVTGYLVTESSTPPSTGAAGWTASAPTIYTVGSAGSYTLYPWAKDAVGNVSLVYGSPASVTVDKTAPTAGGLVATNVTTGGGATYSFTVTFSDNLAVDSTSIDGSDIRVTGPGGFNQLATLVDVTPAGNGTPRIATYQITAPGGAWDGLDRGTYTVAVEVNQIFDSAGNSVGAASLGSFVVSVNYTTYLPLVL